MEKYLQIFILIPLLGYILSLFVPEKREQLMATLSATTVGLFLISLIAFSLGWYMSADLVLNLKEIVVFKSQE